MHTPPEFAAHTSPGQPDHPLADHLRGVAEKAQPFAGRFGSGEWAYLAGLWHDLGKYHPEFQNYLRQKTPRGVNHSLGGALWAQERFVGKNDPRGRILAYLIGCHHTGLTDWHGGLSERLNEEKEHALFKTVMKGDIPNDIRNAPLPDSHPPQGARSGFGLSLWMRMLFSCLVDADFLDTEEYMDGDRARVRNQGYPSLAILKERLDTHLGHKAKEAEKTPLNTERADILRQCREAAKLNSGLFSLSVPTGGGKTLSSMAFALDHAIKHGMERIIYVIPYTSIIEQNAGIFKQIFGAENVIEHHSNFDPGKQEGENDEKDWSPWKLACENWDAPIIVTTNVQFFESLFAARTSRVRKLHNIVNSTVILDEAQLLPVAFLHPVLCAIKQLKENYGTSVVFCTATQPALLKREDNPALKTHGLEDVREIINDPKKLAEKLERVTIIPPADWNTPREWEDIAGELLQHERVLCIVNTRNDARDLYCLLKDRGEEEGLYHLSALMCPAHRSDVIKRIRTRLEADKKAPVRVVSTQLIEAGVDIDFPVVYRAMAGLDSIAQAAGRCNREGTLGFKGGKVVLFVPPTKPPKGILEKAAVAGKDVMRNRGDILSLNAFDLFFRKFYNATNSLDTKGILRDLTEQERCTFQFRSAADNFKLIEEGEQVAIIAPYGKAIEILEEIRRTNLQQIDRKFFRILQPYTVSIYKHEFDGMKKAGKISSVLTEAFGLYTVQVQKQYKDDVGLDSDALPLYMDNS